MNSDFLQREPSQADRALWRTQLAAPPPDHASGLVVLFILHVGGECFGIDPTCVGLAMPEPVIHSIPHRSSTLTGLANVRGSLTLCFSLAKILGIEATAKPPRPMLLVLARHGWRVSCQIDFAEGMEEFDPAALLPTPATMPTPATVHVKGLISRPSGPDVAWLDTYSLFSAFDNAAR